VLLPIVPLDTIGTLGYNDNGTMIFFSSVQARSIVQRHIHELCQSKHDHQNIFTSFFARDMKLDAGYILCILF